MIFSKEAIAVVTALIASTALGCPYLDSQRRALTEEEKNGEHRELWRSGDHQYHWERDFGKVGGIKGGGGGGGHYPTPVERVHKGHCKPDKGDNCYGKIFEDVPSCDFDWNVYLNITLDGGPGWFYMNDDAGRRLGSHTSSIIANAEKLGLDFPTGDDLSGDSENVGAAGYTYLGQLFSHDVNKDKVTKLGQMLHHNDVKNFVSAKADLDTLYGFDEDCNTYLQRNVPEYSTDRFKFKFDGCSVTLPDNSTEFCDIPRYRNGHSIYMPDERNDNNVVLNRITVAFQKYHNKVYDEYKAEGISALEAFTKAKVETQRVWQSVIVNDLMKHLIAEDVWTKIFEQHDCKFYCPHSGAPGSTEYHKAQVPIEFATCAYRIFHSRLVTGYNLGRNPGPGFLRIFNTNRASRSLEGTKPLNQDDFCPFGMNAFFSIDGSEDHHEAHPLDPLYAPAIHKLPVGIDGNPGTVHEICIDGHGGGSVAYGRRLEEPKNWGRGPVGGWPDPDVPHSGNGGEKCKEKNCVVVDGIKDDASPPGERFASLALVDFARAQVHGVSCGGSMAEAAKRVDDNVKVYTKEQLKVLQAYGLPHALKHEKDIPCILYLMFESVIEQKGKFLGYLGSRIVGEFAKGSIKNTPHNYLDTHDWKSKATGTRTVLFEDVLTYTDSACFRLKNPP